ncbi:unnamed protein product, partial [Chrysoparadoxa australica]
MAGEALPHGCSPSLAPRAAAAYAQLRTLSRQLHIMPFSPLSLLRALSLRTRSPLLDDLHFQLLRHLSATYCKVILGWKGKAAQAHKDWRLMDVTNWPAYVVEIVERLEEMKKKPEALLAEVMSKQWEQRGLGLNCKLTLTVSRVLPMQDEEGGERGSKGEGDCEGEDLAGDSGEGGGKKGDGEAVQDHKPIQDVCMALQQAEYHLLPVRIKVTLLEHLTLALLDCDWFVAEMDSRIRQPHGVFETGEDSSVQECILCGAGGSLICCDSCPRAYHAKCINGAKGTGGDTWTCFECHPSAVDPSEGGFRLPEVS